REYLKSRDSAHLQHTFTATSDDPTLDERYWAQAVVSATQASGHEVQPRLTDLATQLDLVTYHMDEPFGSTSIFAQWSVFELARKTGIKVLLDGQGADEQMAGYHNAFGWILADHLYKGRLTKAGVEYREIRNAFPGIAGNALAVAVASFIPGGLRGVLAARRGNGVQAPNDWLNLSQLGYSTPP
ncbi:MAG: asparagine synthetase B, partial [Planctomycetaceae bacterium]|nr:asparagine synthetase B [Planctomycetaceae bacterium]